MFELSVFIMIEINKIYMYYREINLRIKMIKKKNFYN